MSPPAQKAFGLVELRIRNFGLSAGFDTKISSIWSWKVVKNSVLNAFSAFGRSKVMVAEFSLYFNLTKLEDLVLI